MHRIDFANLAASFEEKPLNKEHIEDEEFYNPDLSLHDQIDLLPYDRRWEFPKERLKLGIVSIITSVTSTI